MKKLLLTFALILIILSAVFGQERNTGVKAEQAINLNLLGLVFGGLSYLEYERMVNQFLSVAFRIDYFAYDYKESETNYTYNESGNGFGLGSSVRAYLNANNQLKGFYGGFGMDVISVNWKWDENDSGSKYNGSGSTTSFAIHFQTGYKFNIGNNFHIDPSLYAEYLSTDESLAIGLIVSPALSLGVKF